MLMVSHKKIRSDKLAAFFNRRTDLFICSGCNVRVRVSKCLISNFYNFIGSGGDK